VNYIKYNPTTSNNWMRALSFVQKEKPYLHKRVLDSLTESQVESKIWLNNELWEVKEKVGNVVVMGGWYCHLLCNILFENFNADFVCNYDIDTDSKILSYKFNRQYKDAEKYIVSTKNLFTRELESRQTIRGNIDLFINPSCEHMYYMSDIIERHFQKRPLCVFQSTDDEQYDDHINCVSGPEELAEQTGLVHISYMGTKVLSNGMKRFMVIGR